MALLLGSLHSSYCIRYRDLDAELATLIMQEAVRGGAGRSTE